MNGASTALPNEWIQRLFLRLQTAYGNRLATVYGDVPAADVMDAWATELGGFEVADIRHALDAMRRAYVDYPPTLFQFANLCHDARNIRQQNSAKLYPPRTAPAPEVWSRIRAQVGLK